MRAKIAGSRRVNLLVNSALALTALVLLHLLFIGGIDLGPGAIPGLSKVKLTCNKLSNPFLLLLCLLAVKLLVARPAPWTRFRGCLRRNRRTLLLAALVTAAAAAPRFWRIGEHSLNPDGLTWLDRSQRTVYALRAGDYAKATAHLGHPGVVPAVLVGSSFIYLGEGASKLSYGVFAPLTAARLPIAAVGTATCLLLYLLGRRALGDAAAFWGAIFLSLYPPHIASSRVVHIDSTLALFFACSVLCYLYAAENGSMRWTAASAVCFGLALLTKSPALLVPPVLIFWKGCVVLRDRKGPVRLLEARDLSWIGLGLATYFILFTRLWQTPEQIRWAEYSCYLPHAGQAVAAFRALACVPWQAAAAVLAAAAALRAAAVRRGGRARLARSVFLAAACFAFLRIFAVPIQNQILLLSKTYHIEELGHLKYWMGRPVSHPPRIFYPFMICVQTPPVMLLCTLAGAAVAILAFLRKDGRWRALLLLLCAPAVFMAVMSIGKKMGMRYIEPAFPFLSLLAGIAVARAADAAVALFPPPRKARARAAAHAAAGAVLLAAVAPPIARTFPYCDIYFNSLAGGPAGASRMVLVGTWIGSKETAALLKPLVRDDDSLYVASIHGEFRYHWLRDPPRPESRILINRTRLPHVDWIVFPSAERHRGIDPATVRVIDRLRPLHTLSKCGIDILQVFRIDDPPEQEGRTYEAEDLKLGTGTAVVDEGASNGVAVRGEGPGGKRGALLYGPLERFAAGRWRAVFAMREADRGKGKDSVTRLSVAGASHDEVFGQAEIRGSEMPGSSSYSDFEVDFALDEPRRIQFCVDRSGPGGGIQVDKIAVERIRGLPLISPAR